ncbi:MAG TPA: CDP-glycerol glycerophosphotransferase family protein [Steroidobacteraceae bacterium]|nr:CDP-glycerol glycerophosphotransferase family protein [Steroidobacteraceae bacterium]HQZ80923.1 CDP-glycerol glycerophosphotransferase family protein [Steroidobacteraceae bacterium]
MRRYLFFVSQLYAWAILRPIAAAAAARGDEVAWFFEHEADARYLRAGEHRLTTVAQVRAWQPRAVFVPGNWVPHFFPGLKVEVFHGFSVGKRSEARGHFRIRGSFDLYCTHGPDTTGPFAALAQQHGYFRVVETGWPKLDPLFAGRYPPAAHARPVVLFASTFTESITAARLLRETIARLTATGEWDWLLTLHPKMAPDIVAAYRALEGPQVRFVETDDILALYAQADVLLSDTSSVVPEFLVQLKPVVTLRNRKPGPQLLDVQRPEDVEGALRTALTRPAPLMQAIREYADLVHPARDGHASERVLDAAEAAIAARRAGLRRAPFNLWRRLQARKRLGYWSLG